ncbi:hypothetical protein LCGC14_1671990 [marine sediment metagenome]|uniref:Uncharacterized protein n=1 Tax=marine sediment metagenome TaxID=412755 RepID=A0A0F9HRR6_9ZZZZ
MATPSAFGRRGFETVKTASGVDKSFKELQRIFNSLGIAGQNTIRDLITVRGGNPADSQLVLRTVASLDVKGEGITGIINQAQEIINTAPQDARDRLNVPDEVDDTRSAFDEFLETQRGLTEEFITGEEERRRLRRGELSGLLSEQREAAFDVNAPQILEQLESRGLFTSESTVGTSFAREQGRLQQISENILSQQALSDIDVIGGFRQGALGREIGAEEAFLERGFSIEDFERTAGLARTLAEIQASSQARTDKFGLTGDIFNFLGLIGAGFASRGGSSGGNA